MSALPAVPKPRNCSDVVRYAANGERMKRMYKVQRTMYDSLSGGAVFQAKPVFLNVCKT